MAVTQLANKNDVVAMLGRGLTSSEEARIDGILDKLSELFRQEARRQFTGGNMKVRLKVNGGQVYLPEGPVTEVHSVTRASTGLNVDYKRHGRWLTVRLSSSEFVDVDYDHADAVPELVRLTVADAARKILSIAPEAVSGVVQHSSTMGPSTESSTYATWAQGGQTMLAPDDKAIARMFRSRVPKLWVQSS